MSGEANPYRHQSVPEREAAANRNGLLTGARLGIMMFLEFVVFGAWFATLGLVLATHHLAPAIAPAYLLSALAAILSPMCLGALGDRLLSAQKLLALVHWAGGCVMLVLPWAVDHGSGTLVLALIFIYMLTFQPTLGLVNSISLRHLENGAKSFPYVRLFGPLGWMAAGLLVGTLGLSASTGIFKVAAASSFILAVYALTLPSTPPRDAGAPFSIADVFGIRALPLFSQRNFAVLMACTLLTSISLGVYNAFTSPFLAVLGISNVAGVMAIGQVSEVAFIMTIPFVLRLIGMKWALLAGMGMWGVRFILFALAPRHGNELAVIAVGLHGICNDFFVVIAAIYIDRIAPVQIAAQAQGWLILMISGFGAAGGSLIAGRIFAGLILPHAARGAPAWTPLWLVPIAAAIITTLLWTTLFRLEEPAAETSAHNAA